MMPTFLIIGAMKCGTTSLYHYLAEHPEIGMSRIKETNYFLGREEFERGQAWYQSLFPPAKARGEASPNYSKPWLFRGVPERIYAELRHARLIYLVRDPIERMISHYKHRYADGIETRPLGAALTDEVKNPYLHGSRYYRNIESFLDCFPLDQLLILTSEELRHDRQATLRRVFGFVGVDPAFTGRSVSKEWHRAEQKFAGTGILGRWFHWLRPSRHTKRSKRIRREPPSELVLDDAIRARLIEKLLPDVAQLERLMGRTLSAWNLAPPLGGQERRVA